MPGFFSMLKSDISDLIVLIMLLCCLYFNDELLSYMYFIFFVSCVFFEYFVSLPEYDILQTAQIVGGMIII